MFAFRLTSPRCLTRRSLTLVGKPFVRRVGHRETFDVKEDIKIKELISSLKKDERRELYIKLKLILGEEAVPKKPSSWLSAWKQGTDTIKKYIARPSMSQLNRLFIYHSLPYVAFGCLDNSIMILAGDYIQTTIGIHIGLSTMASAGLGNLLADALSIGMAYHVERFFSKFVKGPKSMTVGQYELKLTRLVIQSARILGISLGCLLGLTPLLFINK